MFLERPKSFFGLPEKLVQEKGFRICEPFINVSGYSVGQIVPGFLCHPLLFHNLNRAQKQNDIFCFDFEMHDITDDLTDDCGNENVLFFSPQLCTCCVTVSPSRFC